MILVEPRSRHRETIETLRCSPAIARRWGLRPTAVSQARRRRELRFSGPSRVPLRLRGGVVTPSPVHELKRAIRVTPPCERRNGVYQKASVPG